MRAPICLLVTALGTTAALRGQLAEEWFRAYSPTAFGDLANAVVIDPAGGAVITGWQGGGSLSDNDAFVVSYSASGDTNWIWTYDGPVGSEDQGIDVAIGPSGNVYAAINTINAGSGRDILLVKFDGAGDTVWTRTYDGSGYDDFIAAIAVSSTEDIYIAGTTENSAIALDEDILLLRFDFTGGLVWASTYDGVSGGQMEDWANDMVYKSGYIYVTGRSRHGLGSSTTDAVVLKFDAAGDTAWTRRYNGPQDNFDEGNAITVDDGGRVFVAGSGHSASSSYLQMLTLRYSLSGSSPWSRHYGGMDISDQEATNVIADGTGGCYTVGSALFAGQGLDYTVAHYDMNGDTLWVRHYNGTSGTMNNLTTAACADAGGNVFITGTSEGTGTGEDFVTVKYSSAGVVVWDHRHVEPGSIQERPWDMACGTGVVFVTGEVRPAVDDFNALTLKYAEPSGIASAPEVKVTVRPNPASDRWTLYSTATSYQLYDIFGRLLQQGQFVHGTAVVDCRNLDAGSYLCRLRAEKGSTHVVLTRL